MRAILPRADDDQPAVRCQDEVAPPPRPRRQRELDLAGVAELRGELAGRRVPGQGGVADRLPGDDDAAVFEDDQSACRFAVRPEVDAGDAAVGEATIERAGGRELDEEEVAVIGSGREDAAVGQGPHGLDDLLAAAGRDAEEAAGSEGGVGARWAAGGQTCRCRTPTRCGSG